mgnify:CR=1 FL=1
MGNAVLKLNRIDQYTPVCMRKIGAVPEEMLAQSLFVAVSSFVDTGYQLCLPSLGLRRHGELQQMMELSDRIVVVKVNKTHVDERSAANGLIP